MQFNFDMKKEEVNSQLVEGGWSQRNTRMAFKFGGKFEPM